MWWIPLFAVAMAADDPFASAGEVHVLDNGLTVILEESRRTDTVALHLAFGVGSRDEQPGEYGCAHLFEHLMFEGSANVPTNMFDEWLTQAGGDNNAWTSEDTTAYHMTFPSGALDLALFLESDRLAFLDAGLTEENVANQRLVVLQERNQGFAEPNGRDWDAISRLTFAPDHPYHHPVIGTVADVEGFQVDAVNDFWRKHYRTQNAVLTLVGNFDKEEALERVRFWFSDVPDAGPAQARVTEDTPAGDRPNLHGMLEDDVEERTLWEIWNTVGDRHADAPALDVLGNVLSWGRGTALDEALYYKKNLTTEEGAFQSGSAISGQFLIYAVDRKTPLKKLDKIIAKVLAGVASEPPSDEVMNRAKLAYRAQILDMLERPWDRAELLTDCFLDTGDANCAAAEWARYEAVTPEDVMRVAQEYLIDGQKQTLSVVPRADDGAIKGAVVVELP